MTQQKIIDGTPGFGTGEQKFVKTGEYRSPREGEFHVSVVSGTALKATHADDHFFRSTGNCRYILKEYVEPTTPSTKRRTTMPDTTVNHKGNEYTLTRRKLREGDLYLAEYTEPLGEVLTCSFLISPVLAWVLEPVIPPVPNDGKPAKNFTGSDWYEFTGEYRVTVNSTPSSEYYWSERYGRPVWGNGFSKPQHIMRKVEKPEAPEGYEHTDEYRVPVSGVDHFINPDVEWIGLPADYTRDVVINQRPAWILRKVEPLPVWYHEGTRVYQRVEGGNGRGGYGNAQFDARMEYDAKHAVYLLNKLREAASE